MHFIITYPSSNFTFTESVEKEINLPYMATYDTPCSLHKHTYRNIGYTMCYFICLSFLYIFYLTLFDEMSSFRAKKLIDLFVFKRVFLFVNYFSP